MKERRYKGKTDLVTCSFSFNEFFFLSNKLLDTNIFIIVQYGLEICFERNGKIDLYISLRQRHNC